MEKKDYFAWNGEHCRVLKLTNCEKCHFYMCKEEYIAKKKETDERLEGRMEV